MLNHLSPLLATKVETKPRNSRVAFPLRCPLFKDFVYDSFSRPIKTRDANPKIKSQLFTFFTAPDIASHIEQRARQ